MAIFWKNNEFSIFYIKYKFTAAYLTWISPSLLANITCPLLFAATALECWLGGRTDNVEAPPIWCFLPAFLFTIAEF